MRNIFCALFVILNLFLPSKAGLTQNDGNTFPYQILELGHLSNKQAILNDPLLPKIVQHIQKKYGVHAVILYGSRARGTANSKSDYDIIGLQKSGEQKKYQEFFQNAHLDISIYPQNFGGANGTDVSLAFFWDEAVILCQ